MKKLHPTLRDVAALAGVSHQTVSRVLNGNEHVSPETRQSVQKAIAQLGYRPNAIARSMASGLTSTLACLSPNLTDFTYASMMEGAEGIARQAGYYLLATSTTSPESFDNVIEQLVEYRRVDGVIIISPYIDDRHTHLPRHIPAVLVGGSLRSDAGQYVYLDNRDGAIQATQHLLRMGHTRIAQLTGPIVEDCSQDRDRGYREALRAVGIEPDPRLTSEGDWTATSGYRFLQQLYHSQIMPTAIVAQNDRMAVGIIRAARDLGIAVPQELSVIGFDDMPLASYFDPPLTTMRQDTFAIGRASAQLLVDLIHSEDQAPHLVRFQTELLVRQSTTTCPVSQRR